MALMMTDEAGYRGLMRYVASCGAALAVRLLIVYHACVQVFSRHTYVRFQ